jgi:hypothetical protein
MRKNNPIVVDIVVDVVVDVDVEAVAKMLKSILSITSSPFLSSSSAIAASHP